MKRTIIASILLVAGGVSGCSFFEDDSSDFKESAIASPPLGGADGDRTQSLDTGEYRTQYFQRFQNTTEKIGTAVESNELGRNMLLAYEVDERFNKGTFNSWILHAGRLAFQLGQDHLNALEQFDDSIQSGWSRVAHDEEKMMAVGTTIIRYDSDKTAEDAALALATVDQTSGKKFSQSDSDNPGEPVQVLAGETVYSTNYSPEYGRLSEGEDSAPAESESHGREESTLDSRENNTLRTAMTYNEFLFYLDVTYEPGKLEEAVEFTEKYYRKQVPKLESLATHKTSSGFGKLAGWVHRDNEDNVARKVVPTNDSEQATYLTDWYNPRMLASWYEDTEEMLRVLEQAGVEYGAGSQALLMKARNESGADHIRSFMLSRDVEDDYQEYDEPQGVPNTTCLSRDDLTSTKYVCYMVKDGYFVESDTRQSNSDDENGKDAQKLLSQRMAAQYEILENVKKNPDGVPFSEN